MPGTNGTDDRPLISVSDAGKRYTEFQVFKDINLEVGSREIISVVGPSGCGKTTLLRCLDGLITLDEGGIFFEGKRLDRPQEGVAMVFQHFGLFPWKTVYQNVAYGLKMAHAPANVIKERVPRYIETVGLAGSEQAYPYQLSGGMQQRCGLARALAVEPKVMLMDEPFAAIDAQTREILQFELLRIWQQRPLAMIFVTHSIEEAVLLGHRVAILKGRPATLHEVVDVDLPEPRDRSTLGHPNFVSVREYVWNVVMDNVQ